MAAKELHAYGSRTASSIHSLPPNTTLPEQFSTENDNLCHTSLSAGEYNSLIKQIRAQTGFQEFLRPTPASNILSSLPTDGPVVVLNIHPTRCDVLALLAGCDEPIHIPLPNFSYKKAAKLPDKLRDCLPVKGRAADGSRRRKKPFSGRSKVTSVIQIVLQELWTDVVQPILSMLGFSVRSS